MNLRDTLENYYRSRRLCKNSISSYMAQFDKFSRWCYSQGLLIEEMPFEGLLEFQGLSTSIAVNNQKRAMLNVLYGELLRGKRAKKLPYAKPRLKLPESLTPDDIQQLISSIPNDKHQLMAKMMYYLALRVSELVTIDVKDFFKAFDPQTGKKYTELHINGKGEKDRRISVPDWLSTEIKSYILRKNVKVLGDLNIRALFPGQFRRHYSDTSVRNIINKAIDSCGFKIEGSTHILRKSRITHLIDAGVNDRTIQNMVGWSSIKTLDHYHKASTIAQYKLIEEADQKISGKAEDWLRIAN